MSLIYIDFTDFLKLNTICDLKITKKGYYRIKLLCQINLTKFTINQ